MDPDFLSAIVLQIVSSSGGEMGESYRAQDEALPAPRVHRHLAGEELAGDPLSGTNDTASQGPCTRA